MKAVNKFRSQFYSNNNKKASPALRSNYIYAFEVMENTKSLVAGVLNLNFLKFIGKNIYAFSIHRTNKQFGFYAIKLESPIINEF